MSGKTFIWDLDGTLLDSYGVIASSLRQTLEELERRAIAEALLEEEGNRTRTARRLGMDRSTLARKMERYSIKG